jgi:hypothetical protein
MLSTRFTVWESLVCCTPDARQVQETAETAVFCGESVMTSEILQF